MATDLIIGFSIMAAITAVFILAVILPRSQRWAGFTTFLYGLGLTTLTEKVAGIGDIIFTSGIIIIITGVYLILYSFT